NLLEALTALRPTLDDLNSVKVARSRVLHRPHCERRGFALERRQIPAHRHALRVAGLDPVRLRQGVGGVFPSAEQANLDVRTADGKGFRSRNRIEDGSPSVFISPDTGQTTSALGARVEHATDEIAGHALLNRPIKKRMTAEVVILTVRHGSIMRVRPGAKTELVRVESLAVLQGEAVLKRLPRVAANNVGNTAGRVAQQHRHDLEVSELIGRREQWVCLGGPFKLLHL